MIPRTTALALLLALASSVAAQPAKREPVELGDLRLGRQVSGSRLTYDDLEGRVVLAYHWCVS
jgi:hypothetical protein